MECGEREKKSAEIDNSLNQGLAQGAGSHLFLANTAIRTAQRHTKPVDR